MRMLVRAWLCRRGPRHARARHRCDAIFSIVDAVLLRPLPYADPERLVVVGDRESDGSASNIGYTTFHDIREGSRSFEMLTVIRSWSPTLISGGEAERLRGMRVSWNFFSMLGVRPALRTRLRGVPTRLIDGASCS
jgi:hypothetical protein